MRKEYRLGEKRINYQGQKMEIVKYQNCHNVDIKFESGSLVKNRRYNLFLSGSVSDPLYPSYLGVGYIGVGKYKTRNNNIKTTAYIHWGSMLTRCYAEKYIERANYSNCVVCNEWLNFQNFAKWHEQNYYELKDESVELDKDIISKGNKIYSPEKCIYVPHKINTVVCNRHNDRGNYLLGVTKIQAKGRKKAFYASCNKNNKEFYIGIFETEQEAFYAYKKVKEQVIYELADSYVGKIPNRVIESIKNYKIEITD